MDTLFNDLYAWLCSLGDTWAAVAAFAVSLCALLCTVIPAPSEDANAVWRFLYSVINTIGCNVGKAANFDVVVNKLNKELAEDAEKGNE